MAGEAFLIDAVRTPIGKYAGSLSTVRADDLAAIVIRSLLSKNTAVPSEKISEVILGCANQAGEDNRNIARMALLLAGLPTTVPGETVNRLCGSGMSAVINAARAVQLGHSDLVIAGGIEHMTRAPYVMAKPEKGFQRSPEIFDTTLGWRFVNPELKKLYGVDTMGETAENVATQFKISRADQDRFALRSQEKASAAQKAGKLAREITPVELPGKPPLRFEADEYIRTDTSLEKLSALKPAFRDGGSVTAGNASGINDGACALLLASEAALKKYGLKPRARFVSSGVAGVEPRIMGMGPVEATRKALAAAKLSLKDISTIELNEAFAAQVLACLRELGLKDDDARVNRLGGAIALGHPLGMSGARLIGTTMYQLEERAERYALSSMCIGVGQGIATVIERVS